MHQLNDEERRKFALWLAEIVKTNRAYIAAAALNPAIEVERRRKDLDAALHTIRMLNVTVVGL